MSAEFIDSNIFVYLFDSTNDAKRSAAEGVVQNAIASGAGIISHQVVQETLAVITQRLRPRATTEDARRFLDRTLAPLWRIMPSQALYHRALGVQSRYGYHFYDALIIGAALEAGCRILYSEDLQDGQQIEGVKIVNPFAGGA